MSLLEEGQGQGRGRGRGGRGRGRGRGLEQGGQQQPPSLMTPQEPKRAPILITPERTLKDGLKYVGFDEVRQGKVQQEKNAARFRAFYGVGHKAVTSLLIDLQTTARPSARVDVVDLIFSFPFTF
jgi:hypothetical protein